MTLVDTGSKIVKRQVISGREQSVAVLEYKVDHDNRKVVTGPIGILPHLDPIDTGIELVLHLRDEYPREARWSLETVPQHCRPEVNALIEAGAERLGHQPYDYVAEVVDFVPEFDDWDLMPLIELPINEWPSNMTVRGFLLDCDAELDAATNTPDPVN